MSARPLLRVEGLTVRYGPVEAVRELDLSVDDGQIVTLIGANGAGKSSTLGALCGLVRDVTGTVVFDGQEISRQATRRLVDQGVVLVPEGRAILAQMTVQENLELGGYRRSDQAQLRRDIDVILERFPILRERRSQRAGSLSGGEQQQLAIARGLLAQPRLLLLDEPSMGLAPLIVRQIFEIIREIRADGVTVLLVEQNARQALAIADRAYVMETGRVVLSGPASELASDPRVQAAYLGGTAASSK
jgi:branched-chain amino acid transport system ATP-binding protein